MVPQPSLLSFLRSIPPSVFCQSLLNLRKTGRLGTGGTVDGVTNGPRNSSRSYFHSSRTVYDVIPCPVQSLATIHDRRKSSSRLRPPFTPQILPPSVVRFSRSTLFRVYQGLSKTRERPYKVFSVCKGPASHRVLFQSTLTFNECPSPNVYPFYRGSHRDDPP